MGFRFRKSIKLLPGVRVNIAKAGPSLSVGRPGATVNFGRRGTKTTVGLAGTGLSYSAMTGEAPITTSPAGMDGLNGFATRLKNIGFGFLVLLAFVVAYRVFQH